MISNGYTVFPLVNGIIDYETILKVASSFSLLRIYTQMIIIAHTIFCAYDDF